MAYSLEGLIAPQSVWASHAEEFSHLRVVPLAMDHALTPLTTELFEEIWERRGGGSEIDPYPEFWKLSNSVMLWALKVSEQGPVAYVEADFFGGTGVQSGMAWREGKVLMEPVKTFLECRAGRLRGALLVERAINQALQAIGVYAPLGCDEFDALGLGRYRQTAEWGASSTIDD